MNRVDVKTGMCFKNTVLKSRPTVLLYIIESNQKYIECWKIEREDGIKDKTFRIGSDWDKGMMNYYEIEQEEFISTLFEDKK